MSLSVSSEIGKLEKVIIHRPDSGISRVSPKRAEELLFDDIVFLPKMQAEHDVLTDILKAFVGPKNVLEITDLLTETIKDHPDNKNLIIDRVQDYEELPDSFGEKMKALEIPELSEVLITGYLKNEDFILFDPIPNFIFTRDIAVVVNDHVVITKASKAARHRENVLTRFIFWRHPIFRTLRDKDQIINLNDLNLFPPSRQGQHVSLEGGDVMIINKDYLLIGCSERTSMHGVHLLKDTLFKKNVVKNVVIINIPDDRSYMHIDTLFTMISEDEIVAYKPIVYDGNSSNVFVHKSNGDVAEYSSVKRFFEAEINPDIKFIFAGDGRSPYQEREQWTDGCNLVALKSGVAITYDRNTVTDHAFKKAGYNIIKAYDLLQNIKSGAVKVDKISKTIIHIPSNELSRARGGSHCMTCPISRK
ncbi:arginine deiminase [Portibacter marinus]|uniref:arginine deiminase n=1 Tax=Portibacter marinus TaxID=2898660 RepID=UPI001F4567D2|nr:arginine deiminase family protein [Portibacter marinus]